MSCTESLSSTDYNEIGIQVKYIPARDQNAREEQKDKGCWSRGLTEESASNSQNPPMHRKEALKLNKETDSANSKGAVLRL